MFPNKPMTKPWTKVRVQQGKNKQVAFEPKIEFIVWKAKK